MTTLKSRLLSAAAAAALALTPVAAHAGGKDVDLVDAKYALSHIVVEVTQLLANPDIDISDLEVVYLKQVLTDAEFDIVNLEKNKIGNQLQLITLTNALNNVTVQDVVGDITLTQFLNNNNVDVSQLVGIIVWRDGDISILSCDDTCGGEGCD